MATENTGVQDEVLDDAPEYLNMSDEDIMNMAPPEPTQAVEAPASDSAAEVPGTAGKATEGEEEQPAATGEETDEQEDQAQGTQDETKSEEVKEDAGSDDSDPAAADTSGFDYKSEYEKLLKP